MNDHLIIMSQEDIQFREPMDGDPVLYFFHNPKTDRHQTDVGIIVKEWDQEHWLITGTPRYKEQVLFVLTLDGYRKQKRLANPLAW